MVISKKNGKKRRTDFKGRKEPPWGKGRRVDNRDALGPIAQEYREQNKIQQEVVKRWGLTRKRGA